MLVSYFTIIIPPATKFRGVYWIHPVRPSVCPSVCLSVCPSVCPSVRPWVGVRMITLILFSGFKHFFTYITWVKILHGIEYQRPTSLNMRIQADHVTYPFLAFPKSFFLVRAFQFGMKGVLSRIPDISPEFCWIPIFVFFLHFYVFLNWPTPSVGGQSCDLLIFGIHEVNFSFLLGMLLRGRFSERAF